MSINQFPLEPHAVPIATGMNQYLNETVKQIQGDVLSDVFICELDCTCCEGQPDRHLEVGENGISVRLEAVRCQDASICTVRRVNRASKTVKNLITRQTV